MRVGTAATLFVVVVVVSSVSFAVPVGSSSQQLVRGPPNDALADAIRSSPAPPEESTDPTMRAFEELGLDYGATPAEVKSAYRQRVKEVHPDHGGDEDEFKRVREAYTMAKQHVAS